MLIFKGSPITALALLGLCSAQDQIPISHNIPSNIPAIGFGTWNLKISSTNTSAAVAIAIQTGYRHIDCAAAYDNQKDVGQGIKDGLEETGLKREDIWVTSKLWNDHHEPHMVAEALDQTLQDLGLDYLDLYLMHWPVASSGGKNTIRYVDTWHAMSALLLTPKVRQIGISNFSPSQLHHLLSTSPIKPSVHQFESHPYLQQTSWVKYHQDHDIMVTAYSPLANLNPIYGSPGKSKDTPPSLLQNKEIGKIAEKRNCTNAQVALKWGMGRGTSVIPKSSHAERIRENLEAVNCELEKEDYESIKEIGEKYLKRFNNPSKDWGVDLYEGWMVLDHTHCADGMKNNAVVQE